MAGGGRNRRSLSRTLTSGGLLEPPPHPRWLRDSDARAEPVTVPGAGTVAAHQYEGTYLPMMYDLDITVVVAAVGIAGVAVVYLWSKDPGRRRRAWLLLKLLLRG